MTDTIWRIGDSVSTAGDRLTGGFVAGAHGWYIVYVTGGDAAAKLALERRGWIVYRPLVTRWVKVKQRGGLRADRTRAARRRGKRSAGTPGSNRLAAPTQKRISVPLYPRYVFVAIDPRRGTWWNLVGTPGVAAVLRHNASEVVRLDHRVIEGLRGVEARGEQDEETPPKSLKPKAGTRVRVIEGPFASLTGVVVLGGDRETVVCELAVFGGSTPVSLPLDDIELSS